MKARRIRLDIFKWWIFTFKLKWSGNRLIPKATQMGLKTYSNKFKNFTYRLDIKSIKIVL